MKIKIDLMNRKYLQAIRAAADKRRDEVLNPHWKEAFSRLSSAADHIDALIVRTELREE